MKRLLEIWGDLEGVATALGAPYSTVAQWNGRGIPLRRLKEIIITAKQDGHIVHPWELHEDFAYLRPEEDTA